MPKIKHCYVNIKNEVVSPFFDTKKEAINYLDNGGKVNDTWMFSLEKVRVNDAMICQNLYKSRWKKCNNESFVSYF